MTRLEARLRTLEAVTAAVAARPLLFVVLCEPEAARVGTVGQEVVKRFEGEPFDAFKQRLAAHTLAAPAPCLVLIDGAAGASQTATTVEDQPTRGAPHGR